MQKLIDAINESVFTIRTKGKATIKDEMAMLKDAGVTEHAESIEFAISTKSKAEFISSLEQLATLLINGDNVIALDALKIEIEETLRQAGATSFRLGSLLLEAREACENQDEFLKWVNDNFGIKKSWAFSLMKVAKVFSGEPWDKVAVGVLYTLQAQASEEQMAEARKFAEAGKLDKNTLKALLSPPVAAVVTKQPDTTAKSAESVQSALMDVTPHDVKGVEASPAPQTAPVIQSEPTAPAEPQSATESRLLLQIEEMTQTISQLSQQLAEYQKPRINSGPAMPMLAQFSSPCLYARLGLSKEDSADKEKILEAFKALAKAGYGRQHEAFPLIDEARHALIHAGDGVAK